MSAAPKQCFVWLTRKVSIDIAQQVDPIDFAVVRQARAGSTDQGRQQVRMMGNGQKFGTGVYRGGPLYKKRHPDSTTTCANSFFSGQNNHA
jgi:hypothetical protein